MVINPDITDSSAKILRQLYFFRIITISFLFVMIAIAVVFLKIQLPILPVGLILFLMIVSNLLIRYLIEATRDASFRLIYVQLLLEILLFAGILYYTGGATNPFTFLFLMSLAIAATVLPGLPAWSLTLLTVLLYSLLLKFYVPLSYEDHSHHAHMAGGGQFTQHVLGMWFGFMLSAVLVTWFITYLARELKQRDQAIAEARQRELRDQQMVTLGTLAAGTAHELGTPLASLAVVSGEITDGYDPQKDADLFDNQRILLQQIERCKEILSVLSDSAGESRADAGFRLPVAEFIGRIEAQWRSQREDTLLEVEQPLALPSGDVLFDKTISQALINLLNNSADATRDLIRLVIDVEDGELVLEIQDSGTGLSEEQIAMAGDTSFSSKPDGMGIGLFLAITTIRRSGGSVAFQRREPVGTSTIIRLPLLESRYD